VRRGDIALVALPGDYGKARPALVVQNDLVNDIHASITVCPLTTHCIDAPLFRIPLDPAAENGLLLPSQVMVDKVSSVKRERLRGAIGRVDDAFLVQVGRALALWLGL